MRHPVERLRVTVWPDDGLTRLLRAHVRHCRACRRRGRMCLVVALAWKALRRNQPQALPTAATGRWRVLVSLMDESLRHQDHSESSWDARDAALASAVVEIHRLRVRHAQRLAEDPRLSIEAFILTPAGTPHTVAYLAKADVLASQSEQLTGCHQAEARL